jgi:DNA-binding NarL/FixJ family response regulator
MDLVFIVDDNPLALRPWTDDLALRGLATEVIPSAGAAFRRLWNARSDEVGLVVIDLMLSVEDLGDPRFSAERTSDYRETGLVLLRDLIQQNPDVFPSRAVLLSNAPRYETFRNAQAGSADHKIPFWNKAEIDSPLHFGDLVTRRLCKLRRGESS